MKAVKTVLRGTLVFMLMSSCSGIEKKLVELSERDYFSFCNDTVAPLVDRPDCYIVNTFNEMLIVKTNGAGMILNAHICGQSLEGYRGNDNLYQNAHSLQYRHLKRLMELHNSINQIVESDCRLKIDSSGTAFIEFPRDHFSYQVLVLSTLMNTITQKDVTDYRKINDRVFYKRKFFF